MGTVIDLAISQDDTLSTVLARLPVDRFLRLRDGLDRLGPNPDYVVSESFWGIVTAAPRDGAGPVVVRRPPGPGAACVIGAEGRELGVHFAVGFGGHIAQHAHRVFELRDGERSCGTIDEFSNPSVAFTNPDPCDGLSIIRYGDAGFFQYRGSLPQSWWRVSPFSVTLDGAFAPVATMVGVGSVFTRTVHVWAHRPLDPFALGLLVASHRRLTAPHRS